MMTDPALKKMIKKEKREAEKTFDRLLKKIVFKYPSLFPADQIRKEDFVWAFFLITSRCVEIVPEETLMIPYVDMFNHTNRPHLEIGLFNRRYENGT